MNRATRRLDDHAAHFMDVPALLRAQSSAPATVRDIEFKSRSDQMLISLNFFGATGIALRSAQTAAGLSLHRETQEECSPTPKGSLWTARELEDRLSQCKLSEYAETHAAIRDLSLLLHACHEATSTRSNGSEEWVALRELQDAAASTLNKLPSHFELRAKLADLVASTQIRSAEILERSMTRAVPRHLHFVWIGRVGDIQTEYISKWVELNPGHDVTVHYDPGATLSPVLGRQIKVRASAPVDGGCAPSRDRYIASTMDLQDRAVRFISDSLRDHPNWEFDDAALHFMQEVLGLGLPELEEMRALRAESQASYPRLVQQLRLASPDRTGSIQLQPIKDLFSGSHDEGGVCAAELRSAYMKELCQRGNLAAASDIARILALRQHGGIYLDADQIPVWHPDLRARLDELHASLMKDLPSQTLKELEENGTSMNWIFSEAVMDKLADMFQARRQMKFSGRYFSGIALLPDRAQQLIRSALDAHAREKGLAAQAWFDTLQETLTAPGMMRFPVFPQGATINSVLSAEKNAGDLNEVLKVIQRNYRVLATLEQAAEREPSLPPSMKRTLFNDAMRAESIALDCPAASSSSFGAFDDYRREFASDRPVSTLAVSGPAAQAEPALAHIHALTDTPQQQAFSFSPVNLFTEENRNSSWATDAFEEHVASSDRPALSVVETHELRPKLFERIDRWSRYSEVVAAIDAIDLEKTKAEDHAMAILQSIGEAKRAATFQRLFRELDERYERSMNALFDALEGASERKQSELALKALGQPSGLEALLKAHTQKWAPRACRALAEFCDPSSEVAAIKASESLKSWEVERLARIASIPARVAFKRLVRDAVVSQWAEASRKLRSHLGPRIAPATVFFQEGINTTATGLASLPKQPPSTLIEDIDRRLRSVEIGQRVLIALNEQKPYRGDLFPEFGEVLRETVRRIVQKEFDHAGQSIRQDAQREFSAEVAHRISARSITTGSGDPASSNSYSDEASAQRHAMKQAGAQEPQTSRDREVIHATAPAQRVREAERV